VDVSAVLADAEDRVVDEAVAALAEGDQPGHHGHSMEERRRDVRQLFRLVVRCMREGSAESIITPSGRIAAHCFAAGTDLAEVQSEFINHLVPWDRLESFTLELAATMATKSPLAIAVIKEQLNVLSDYQPVAAQVYERVQGLRRQAYDSSDYLEGLNAFAEKRPPMFRGA
jgi:Enoyl-CoA hydratase/isomerase